MSANKHRLVILTKHLNRWLEKANVSQTAAAQEIVEQFRALGLDKELQAEDIFFMDTGDVFTDANTNRQKIFRWLGYMDNGTKKSMGRLWLVEQAIVAAMPADIRVAYLNEVFGDCGVCISSLSQDRSCSRLDVSRVVESMIKEDSEAQIALLKLGVSPTPAQVCDAHLELRESVGTQLAVLDWLERKFPVLAKKKSASVFGDRVAGSIPANTK
ncbi:hypothetical protein [Hahella sp. NBU794]|uniref:hypothetical protein n=1 Tax=Hahella sp. NBU794 TaxID=3422590 RepID=UPI003D6E37D3